MRATLSLALVTLDGEAPADDVTTAILGVVEAGP